MNLNVGYIPYLNMVPFHQGFGSEPMKLDDLELQFRSVSPRALGVEAEAGRIDVGAMSLIDSFRLADRFEPLGHFGIGVKRAAGSVLLFSKGPLADLQGLCAVTDETSTSVRLLQVLLEKRYQRTGVSFGRIASGPLYDGSAESLLLIGDEALKARREGIRDLPCVTDLGAEWFAWQGTPFTFAQWVVRKDLTSEIKNILQQGLEKSLSRDLFIPGILNKEAEKRGFSASEIADYWRSFHYRLTPEHDRAVETFKGLVESVCLTA